MYWDRKIWIGNSGDEKVTMSTKMANRHGLIAGATGTGKTVTLKVLAESFSDAGVTVLMSDAKGDLSGMCMEGIDTPDMQSRIQTFGLEECGFSYTKYPATFWDIFGECGIPLRTTISEMGPILLSKLMELNDTQSDIMACLFKMADDEGLLLYDIKDLKAILQYALDNTDALSREYGGMSKASLNAIIRNVVALEAAGGDMYFSEPAINIADFFVNNIDGRGTINILDSKKLASDPTLYGAFLLYLLSELFETLPEIGDQEKPRLVIFFDEAHLLFKDMSKSLQNKIEQIVKLIRSKGVGLYFITQSPSDIPDAILSQLGNKIQHALHAYTPAEEKAIKAAAQSFRVNPEFDTKEVLQNMGVGEAIVSVLDDDGIPTIAMKTKILPPRSAIGPVGDEEKKKLSQVNNLYLKYKDSFDPDSAYEFLSRQQMQKDFGVQNDNDIQATDANTIAEDYSKETMTERMIREKREQALSSQTERESTKREKQPREPRGSKSANKAMKSVASTAAGTIGREIGQNVGKSVGGSFGKKLGGNVAAQLGRSIMGTLFK